MSGEAVAVSTLLATPAGMALVAGVGVVVLGGLALKLAHQWQEQQRLQAMRMMREEKQKLAAWRDYQAGQQRRMEAVAAGREAARGQLAGLRLRGREEQLAEGIPKVQARGFVQAVNREELGQILQDTRRFLQDLPVALHQADGSPLPRLLEECGRMQAQSVQPEPVYALQETARRTVAAYLDELARQQHGQAERMAQVENLLSETLAYRQMPFDERLAEEWRVLQNHLVDLLRRDGATPAALAVLDRKLRALKAEAEAALEQAAIQASVQQRLDFHLHEMGYRRLAGAIPEQDDSSTWRIPGGEQVRVGLQRDHRLAFQIAHERDHATSDALSREELAFLRQQEGRWCKDLAELLKRLQGDGFPYQTAFEREIPEASIPTVVLESVQDILADEERSSAPGKRYLAE
jgi:hypothetical protein